MGHSKIKKPGMPNLIRIKLSKGTNIKDAIKKYQANPMVEYAQPNYIYHLNSIPNDTDYNELWGLKNNGQKITAPSYKDLEGNFIQNPGTEGKDMNFERAWDEITDCSSVIVAVIDTGVNYTHEDLADNMWDGTAYGYPHHGYDFYDNDDDPMDMEGHGTHVSGTIGAVGNNNTGITGACWNVQIMALKVFGSFGEGSLTTGVIDAIKFAADKGASVINMSLGVEGEFDRAFSDAIQYAGEKDVLVVVSAGNGGNDMIGDDNDSKDGGDSNVFTRYFPCNFTHDNLLCVAALDQNYDLSYFTNYGLYSVDVAAPGVNVRSSYFGRTNNSHDDFSTGWDKWSSEPGEENNWKVDRQQMNGYLVNYASFPYNYDGTSVEYQNNQDAYFYKNFGGYSLHADAFIINFISIFDLDKNSDDYVSINYINSDEHPFGPEGKQLGFYSGSSEEWSHYGNYIYSSIDMTEQCSGKKDCTFGYRFHSDDQYTSNGITLLMFMMVQKFIGNEYKCADGTSMSSPHITGLAALIKAFNPQYTSIDIAESISNGGDEILSLKDKIRTGKAADAWGSLSYISKPKNVRVSIDAEIQ